MRALRQGVAWETGASVSAVDAVEAEVRELVRRRGLDPISDRVAMRRLVDEVVSHYDERALTSALSPLVDSRQAARTVYDAVTGFGPLQRHLDEVQVEVEVEEVGSTDGWKAGSNAARQLGSLPARASRSTARTLVSRRGSARPARRLRAGV